MLVARHAQTISTRGIRVQCWPGHGACGLSQWGGRLQHQDGSASTRAAKRAGIFRIDCDRLIWGPLGVWITQGARCPHTVHQRSGRRGYWMLLPRFACAVAFRAARRAVVLCEHVAVAVGARCRRLWQRQPQSLRRRRSSARYRNKATARRRSPARRTGSTRLQTRHALARTAVTKHN